MDRTVEEQAKTVFTTCSCIPEEIITAAGLRPWRLLPDAPPASADSHIHPNTCGYVKSLLASALGRQGCRASCIAIGNSCDGMRKLYDLWGAYAENVPALFLDVPKKRDTDSISFFASELRRFAGDLERAVPGAGVTDERLRSAIDAHDRVRLLMGEVFELQRDRQGSVRGTDVFELCLRGTRSRPAEFAGRLEEFLSSVEQRGRLAGERRILLAGNVIHRPEPVAMLEDLGARVVVLDTCTGLRHYQTSVEPNGSDPMLALAKRYLTRPSCPRMEGLEERLGRLERLADEARSDGIVYCGVKFCDPLIYDIPMMSDWFREAGIPFLFLEDDYTWSGAGQRKTRLQAFTELEPRRGRRDV